VLIVPTLAFPPGIPFTLQFTAVFVAWLTIAANVCASPSSTEAEAGVRLMVTLEGGGCDGAKPATPPQPRRDAAKNNAAHQQTEIFAKLWRSRNSVLRSMHRQIARAVPARGIDGKARYVDDAMHRCEESNGNKSCNFAGLVHFLFRDANGSPPECELPASVCCPRLPFQIGKNKRFHCFRAVQHALPCRAYSQRFSCATSQVDTATNGLNNRSMPRSESVRRVKSYSAATGYVYQYYFFEVEKVRRGYSSGTEYVYMVSANRQNAFPVRILVLEDAVNKWSLHTGQRLTGTEQYAVAKMRLFHAFDEIEGLAADVPDLFVDDSNLETLLSQLDL
jgi:hypothetical protein